MKRGFCFILLVSCLVFLFLSTPVLAAKKRPPRGSGKTTAQKPAGGTSTRGVRSSVKFRPDRRGLLINFSSFDSVMSVTYTLTYTADGVQQGAKGTAMPETAGQQRELLFGTCSAGVCRYHANITNARLMIDSKLPSGLTVRKPYRIKV